MIRLGQYFTLAELCVTSQDLDNVPGNVHLVNLTRLVCLVLGPLRLILGVLHVTSGFRCELVNRKVGGKTTSFHTTGCAADIYSNQHTHMELIKKILELGLPFDKLIAEDDGENQWLHIQIQPPGTPNRKLVFTSHIEDGKMIYVKVE